MKKNFTFLLIFVTAFTLILTGCRKTETDPCEGLLNESPPTETILKFIDKQTKETLVANASVVKIIERQSGKLYTNWTVYNRTGMLSLNGAVVFPVFSETPGEYQYNIQFGNAGTAVLSYQITREETGNRCKAFSYPFRDIKIVDQPFDVFQYEGKTFPKILVVAL